VALFSEGPRRTRPAKFSRLCFEPLARPSQKLGGVRHPEEIDRRGIQCECKGLAAYRRLRISFAHSPKEFVASEGRPADLIITGTGRRSRVDPADLIMGVGRPGLSSPEAEELRFKSAIVAWKETRESRPLRRTHARVDITFKNSPA
jgi:hypothetical protein